MSKSPTFEFHVSRAARERYSFSDALFSITGNVVFANVAASREFAQKMNQARDAQRHPERAINPGALNAMGLIDEALHAVAALYREQRDPKAMVDSLAWFEQRLGREALDGTLLAFGEQFPTVAVYRGQHAAHQWLSASTAGVSNRAIAMEELTMLWLANANPGFRRFNELFDDAALARATAYPQITAALREYFETRPRFGPENQNLIDMLRAPALASPDSLAGQLAYIREKWAMLLGDFINRLLSAVDVLKEEEVAIWMRFHPPGPHFGGAQTWGDSSAAAIPSFAPHEYERFSQDVEWMPRTVLVAKSVYVWLHQLSKQYRRAIDRLDQIPNEELEVLARRGFNALWLIGVWERSQASRRIKQMMGNPEAAASAYSLYDYSIANDLGGEAAYINLRDRAAQRGIRLASDMVPNHMGIDSRWVIQHPDWFLSLGYKPYPSYSFEGPDVSSDGRVEIKIEDHYFDKTDAAVAFRRVDRWSGETRYIYHGNDGTSFPWNDTAQLNYLKAEVREAVIQTILHVARLFPIIRFDAAMTLTKQHYQRLWFPAPGTGGAIPSRAEHGLTKQQFDEAMPQEFWRELVDRVAAEVPGTLLLAEAFWLLEGYFVRTLGMHRVYNSAFMNMLRDEENANYRSVIKKTLEFDPEVLKRYVNFMNNPDERTAVDQFGKGDKYFGICTLMATLPGLPMFGHGQVEGYTERYGMEYRRAYHDEAPDQWLVARHEREISPLLHRRALFAEVRDFLLYDFYTDDGHVNEDVFAYSNRLGDQRALVVYHNRYGSTGGWIRASAAYCDKDAGRQMRQRTLGEGFGLSHDGSMYLAYRDAFTGLEYLQRARDVAQKGLRFELGAYKCHVFMDWRDVRDDGTRPWGALCDMLAGRGVASLDDELRALELKPICDALRGVVDPELARMLAEATGAPRAPAKASKKAARKPAAKAVSAAPQANVDKAIATVAARVRGLLEELRKLAGTEDGRAAGLIPPEQWRGTIDDAVTHFEQNLRAAARLNALDISKPSLEEARAVLPVGAARASLPAIWATVLAWCAVEALGRAQNAGDPDKAATTAFDALHLRSTFAEVFEHLGYQGDERWRAAARVRAAFADASWAASTESIATTSAAPLAWLHDPELAWLIGLHEYEGARYFVKELFERLLWWMALPSLLSIAAGEKPDTAALKNLEVQLLVRMRSAAETGYRVESLLER